MPNVRVGTRRRLAQVALIVTAGALTGFPLRSSAAAALSEAALIQRLQKGGLVLVMRHASAPMEPPDAAHAESDNPGHERQLDQAGKTGARAFGAALRSLHIQIGEVISSPTYRALETVRYAGLPAPKTAPELGDEGASMQAVAQGSANWLKLRVAEAPAPDMNRLFVTHMPNVLQAFGDEATGLGAGDMLVWAPHRNGPPELLGRIRFDAWPALAAHPEP